MVAFLRIIIIKLKTMRNLKQIFVFLFMSAVIFGQNVIINSGFDDLSKTVPNPKGYCHTPGSNHWSDATPAKNWSAWINNPTENSCMVMEVVNLKTVCNVPQPPKNSLVSGNLMHIISTIGHSGFAQNPLPKNKGVKASCWVYVIRGNVNFGVINGADNSLQNVVTSQTTCKWEYLSFEYKNPIDNLTIYSKWANNPMNDGAEFYIDNIIIENL